jgi:hypothetical protein
MQANCSLNPKRCTVQEEWTGQDLSGKRNTKILQGIKSSNIWSWEPLGLDWTTAASFSQINTAENRQQKVKKKERGKTGVPTMREREREI